MNALDNLLTTHTWPDGLKERYRNAGEIVGEELVYNMYMRPPFLTEAEFIDCLEMAIDLLETN